MAKKTKRDLDLLMENLTMTHFLDVILLITVAGLAGFGMYAQFQTPALIGMLLSAGIVYWAVTKVYVGVNLDGSKF